MSILIATDAWEPQVNGVVQTLVATIRELEGRGQVVRLIAPHLFRRMPMPGYREIELAWPDRRLIRAILHDTRPEHIHIATEGPIGWAMRRIALSEGRVFTTGYHTRFPEYLRTRFPVPVGLTYAVLRRFHNAGQGVLVATPSIRAELERRGFRNVMHWGRGVDLSGFRPDADNDPFAGLPRPIFLSVGRLAPEKNLDAFLSLPLPGTKVVIGDGPAAPDLKARFPEAVFLGAKAHADLPRFYACADAFVFPSRTDTFGLVLIEALACGLPVAAYPAPGLSTSSATAASESSTRIWARPRWRHSPSTARPVAGMRKASHGRTRPTSSWPVSKPPTPTRRRPAMPRERIRSGRSKPSDAMSHGDDPARRHRGGGPRRRE